LSAVESTTAGVCSHNAKVERRAADQGVHEIDLCFTSLLDANHAHIQVICAECVQGELNDLLDLSTLLVERRRRYLDPIAPARMPQTGSYGELLKKRVVVVLNHRSNTPSS
jgi:hypothetical protein